MRTLLVIASAAAIGCGARATEPTLPTTPAAQPVDEGDDRDEPAGQTTKAEPEVGDGGVPVIDLEPVRIQVVGENDAGEPELVAYDARSLLDDGNEALAEGRNDDSIGYYEKLLAMFPDSRLAPSATYNIGLAHEAKGEFDAAILRYRSLARAVELGRDSIDAHLRIAAVQAELERWTQAKRTLDQALARADLTHTDRVEAMARSGYVELEQGDFAAAEQTLTETIEYYDKLTSGLDTNYFVAMAHYYLAQIPHRQFLAIPMRLPDEQLRKDLEAKSELVARAYDRYVTALDIRHVYWATASGYQMSQIYKELWDDVVRAPIPPQLSPAAAEIYVSEVHQRVLPFLRKAMEGHSVNVQLAGAYRASTVWSEASRKRVVELSQLLAREASGEIVVPPPRQTQKLGERIGDVPAEYVPKRISL